MGFIFFIGAWLFFIIGWILNLFQVVGQWMALEVAAEVGGLLVVKTICIFVAPAGSILGWVGLF